MQLFDAITRSNLVPLSFDWRSETVSAEESASVASWLMEEFLLSRCAFLASAVSRQLGREHYVAWIHPDGQIAHAVVACSPQFDTQLRGDGIDVLGRRSLKVINDEIRALAPSVAVSVAEPIETDDFAPNEERYMIALAEELPWFRRVLRLEPQQPDGNRILQAAALLGR
jgi:hypothetical protein